MQHQESPTSDASNLPSGSVQPGDGNQVGNADAPRKRLKRRPIACTECRRRKAKCNRQTPCSECIKRGEANLCNGAHCETDDTMLPFWPAGARSINIPATTYLPANAADVHDLIRRVIAIEKRLALQPQSGAPHLTPTEPNGLLSPSSSNGNQNLGLPQSEQDSNPDDGLEAAVKNIESVALEYFGEPAALPSPDQISFEQTSSAEYNAARGTIWQASGPSRTSLAMKLVQGNNPLHSIVQALPRRETCRTILQAFHDYADEGLHYVHRPSFTAQCEQFLNLDSPADVERLDPAWLALFTSALAHGAKALHLRDPGYSTGVPLHVKLHAATQLALHQAEWTSRPQARVIQALIGMACLLSHTGSVFFADPTDRDLGGGEHCRTLLGTAVSLARRLGLHHLDDKAKSSECSFLLDTSFATPGPSSLHTELGRRLWWSLVTLDAKSSIGKENERHIAPNSYSTPLPSRTLDESLGPNPQATLVPKGYFSDADTIIYQARLIEFLDCVPRSKQASYSEVMTLDGLWRTRFQELLGLDMGDTGWVSTQPYLHNQMQTTLIGALHARLLRLHRPYFLKGLRLTQYERSYKTCLQCAQAILTVLASPVVAETNVYQWWAYQHAINAAIVIVLAHLHRVSNRIHAVGTDEGLEQALRPARILFQKGESSLNKAVSATGKQCRQLLELLCSIEPRQTATSSSPDILVSALGQAAQSLHQVSPSSNNRSNSDTHPSQVGNPPFSGNNHQSQTGLEYNLLGESAMLVPDSASRSRDQPTESLAALSQELLHYLGSDSWKADAPSSTMSSLFDLPSMGLDGNYLGQDSLGADYSWLFQAPAPEATST